MSRAATHWRPLPGDGPALVLAVHFDAGSGGAGFADLAANLGCCRMFETIPPPSNGSFLEESEPVGYVTTWLDEIIGLGPPVHAVLGYCAGSSLARTLAAAIGDAGFGDPALVTLAPERVDAGTIGRVFSTAVDSLAGQLNPEELSEARQVVREADQQMVAGETLTPLIARLDNAYRVATHAACRRLRVAPALERQLSSRFATYITYLLACSRAETIDSGQNPIVVGPPVDGSSLLAGLEVAELVTSLLVTPG